MHNRRRQDSDRSHVTRNGCIRIVIALQITSCSLSIIACRVQVAQGYSMYHVDLTVTVCWESKTSTYTPVSKQKENPRILHVHAIGPLTSLKNRQIGMCLAPQLHCKRMLKPSRKKIEIFRKQPRQCLTAQSALPRHQCTRASNHMIHT